MDYETKRMAIRIRCRTDLDAFARHLFPEACRLPWSRLHRYLMRRRLAKTLVDLDAREGALDVVIAPRGAAKSTLVSLVFPIHALLYRTERYIVLISATLRQATMRLANIRGALLTGGALREFFPEELAGVTSAGGKPGGRRGRATKTTPPRARLTANTLEVNGVRIDAFSAGTELRGISHGPWRPTWIILDDAERSDRALAAVHRDALAEWFSEVIENLGSGATNIDVIGTLLHADALPARLARRPDATARTFASIVREAADTALWEQWREIFHNLEDPQRVRRARAFFNQRREAMLAGAAVLWPEKEDYYALQVMRETRGRAAFDKEKQNVPWRDGAAVFDLRRLRRFRLGADGLLVREPPRYLWAAAPGGEPHPAAPPPAERASPSLPLDDLRVFGFLDPALGGSTGDFAAIVTVGADPAGYLYVLDAWLERAAPSRQIERAFDLHARWRYAAFGIETNAFQKLLLEPIEAERARRQGRGEPWDLPITERRHRGDKHGRIMGLEPLVTNGWLLFDDGLCAELLRQLEEFPGSRHDDGPDALAAAVDLARHAALPATPPASLPRRVRGAAGNY